MKVSCYRNLVSFILFAAVFSAYPTVALGATWVSGLNAWERLRLATCDARITRPFEVKNNLVKIDPDNEFIIHKDGRVLFASFMQLRILKFFVNERIVQSAQRGRSLPHQIKLNSNDLENLKKVTYTANDTTYNTFASNFPQKTLPVLYSDLSWVIPSNRLSSRLFVLDAKANAENRPDLRTPYAYQTFLNALLGLAPDHVTRNGTPIPEDEREPKIIVEMWVDLDDILRPTANPRPHSSSAYTKEVEGKFTADVFSPPHIKPHQAAAYRAKKPEWFSRDADANQYTEWYEQSSKKLREGYSAVPFSGLGYTIRHDDNNFGEMGESEYCVKRPAKVEIANIYSLDEYAKESVFTEKNSMIEEQVVGKIINFTKEMADEFAFAYGSADLDAMKDRVRTLMFDSTPGNKDKFSIIQDNLQKKPQAQLRKWINALKGYDKTVSNYKKELEKIPQYRAEKFHLKVKNVEDEDLIEKARREIITLIKKAAGFLLRNQWLETLFPNYASVETLSKNELFKEWIEKRSNELTGKPNRENTIYEELVNKKAFAPAFEAIEKKESWNLPKLRQYVEKVVSGRS